MRDFHFPIYRSDLINKLDFGGQSSMYAQYLIFDDSAQRQVVERLIAVLPRCRIAILLHNFIVEAIHCRDLTTFVIASQQSYLLWVLDLVAEQKLDGLDAVVATIHEITDEDVAARGNFATHFE